MKKGLIRGCFIWFISMGCLSAQAAGTDFMGTGSVDINLPSDDFWDKGYGVTFQARSFYPNKFGVGMSAGWGLWDAENQNSGDFNMADVERLAVNSANKTIRAENVERGFDPITLANTSAGEVNAVPFVDSAVVSSVRLSGDANLFPIGGSVYFRPVHKGGLSVIVEGGLRYIVVDSGVDFEAEYTTDSSFIAATSLRAEQERTRSAVVSGPTPVRVKERVGMDDAIAGLIAVDLVKALSRDVSIFCGLDYMFDIDEIDIDGEAKQLIDDVSLENFSIHFGVGIRY